MLSLKLVDQHMFVLQCLFFMKELLDVLYKFKVYSFSLFLRHTFYSFLHNFLLKVEDALRHSVILFPNPEFISTLSAVAAWTNRVEIIANDVGNRTTPSYVAFNKSERLIGDAAKHQASMNSENTILIFPNQEEFACKTIEPG